MIKDLRIHGVTGPDKEFYATFCGKGVANRYFHEVIEGGGATRHRFFSGGSEFIIDPEAISHRGNGGSFCPYMFGVEEPIQDLVKPDVINRLILFGAVQDETAKVRVTENTAGMETFKEVFLRGHAVFNYFFFVHFDRDVEGAIKTATSLIEPIMITVMGVVVGAIAMGLLMPIFTLSRGG